MATTTLPRSRERPAAHPLNHILDTYTTSHPLRSPSPLPPSSRVDPKLTQRLGPASSNPFFWTIPTWITFLRFAAAKGLHIIWSLVKHFLWGPPRKSWGYRMTFITSFMRNVADHTSLADIVLIRRLVSLHFLIPLPADAVVTPITFVVPRNTGDDLARGFLREFDLEETGSRELGGEWVVGTDVWKRLKADRRSRRFRNPQRQSSKLSGTPAEPSSTPLASEARKGHRQNSIGSTGTDTPEMGSESDYTGQAEKERVIYYVHGGAYYVGNAATHRLVTIGVSKACNARVFAITYRLAPEHVFPLPLHDVLHGYLRLLAPPLSIPPENIIIAGDSAGGGLSLALVMYLRDEGYKMPAGIVLMSPWVDLTMSCGSWDDNLEWDVVPRPEADDHLNPVGCYLGPKGISTYLTHPYASPLFGDFQGLPPMLIQSGDSEVLRDEITLLAHKATLAGVEVTHELYEDMVHVFQMFTFLPAAKASISSVGRWVRQTLPKIEEERTKRTSGIPQDGIDDELQTHESRLVDAEGQMVDQHGLTREEVAAVGDRDQFRAEGFASGGGLHLDFGASDRPSVDVDSLPGDSRSGSPTPTGTPRSAAEDPFNSAAHAQQVHNSLLHRARSSTVSQSGAHGYPTPPALRRALTETAPSLPTSPTRDGQSTDGQQRQVRQRRHTRGAASLHVSPAARHAASPTSGPSSPTMSIRRRLRSPTLTSPSWGTSSISQKPSMRERSDSHSDIFNLMEGYVEGGAANETVVYAPGGEIRSVGVLGEDEED